jgi:hypothetical protein
MTYAETEILAISPALGRLSILQQVFMTRRIAVGVRMPSASSPLKKSLASGIVM